ncbi:MAG: insulinase family protein [Cytophagales bacterium]|nr:MAG: insulinase family protein [Cytophagales bacterium]
MLDRTIPPPIKSITDFILTKPSNLLLQNGMPAHFVAARVQPIVSVQLIFETGGSWFVPSVDVNHFTAKMLLEGTQKHTSTQFSTEIDGYGAFLEVGTAMDYASLDFQCLKKHLPRLLELACELLTQATFPAQELDKLKTIAIQNIKINNQKTSNIASNELRAMLFGKDHPYGYTMTEESIAQIEIEQLKNHYPLSFFKQPFRLLAAGDISEVEIKHIDNFLGKLAISDRAKKEVVHEKKYTTQSIYIEKDNAVQTSIRLGKHVLSRKDDDFVPLNVLNTILGGFFGSRLMKNIREEKGLSYGISSSLGMLKNAGYMVVGTDVKKELRQQALDEIYKEIRKLAVEPVGEDELNLVKSYIKGSFIGSLNTPFALASRYLNIYTHNLPEDYYDHQINRIDQVTSEKLLELAAKYYQDDFTEIMVG